MGEQLSFMEQLSAPGPGKKEKHEPKFVASFPLPKDSLVYLQELVDTGPCLIFMIGANEHVRFVRTFAKEDLGVYWHDGKGCSVVYGLAKGILRDGGYYRHGTHVSSEKVGNTGQLLKATVWHKG